VIKFLVGNKADLRAERKVDAESGQKLAAKYDMTFMEVSAKDGANIEKLFNELGHQVHKKIKSEDAKDNGGRISLASEGHEAATKEGCKC
jgi:GTPase SAR1 family protein